MLSHLRLSSVIPSEGYDHRADVESAGYVKEHYPHLASAVESGERVLLHPRW